MSGAGEGSGLPGVISAAGGSGRSASDTVKRALQAVRSHLGMEVAYVSEFVDGRSVFREVDAPGLEALIKVGDSHSLDDVYCRHILEGRLPELIADTSKEPFAMALPITKAVPIGAHMSVPLRLPDGQPFGMFCCLSPQPNPTLNQRDLQMMRAFAELAAFEINRDMQATRTQREKRERIQTVMEAKQLSIVYQPIWNMESNRLVGFEGLSRFSATPVRSPDLWFAEAAEVGLGKELEMAAISAAISASRSFPPDIYIAVNASPDTILCDGFRATLDGATLGKVVLEITEHAPVSDYTCLLDALRPLREDGLRLAVDDAGAGYSSLQHILHLRPDLIKLDMALTRHIDIDPVRRALAAALIGFARDTGSRIIAEGVETPSELATLRSLGVQKAQGYLLGRPMSLEKARTLFNTAPAVLRVA